MQEIGQVEVAVPEISTCQAAPAKETLRLF